MTLKDKIREEILNQLRRLVELHPDMTVSFEYNDSRQVFLISYDFENERSDDDSIWDEIFDLQCSFDSKFGVDAPLFCQGNRLYELSSNAEVIVSSKKGKIEDMWTLNLEVKASPIVYSSQNGCYSELFRDGVQEYSLAA